MLFPCITQRWLKTGLRFFLCRIRIWSREKLLTVKNFWKSNLFFLEEGKYRLVFSGTWHVKIMNWGPKHTFQFCTFHSRFFFNMIILLTSVIWQEPQSGNLLTCKWETKPRKFTFISCRKCRSKRQKILWQWLLKIATWWNFAEEMSATKVHNSVIRTIQYYL